MWRKIVRFRATSILFLFSFILILGGTLWTYFSLKGASGPFILRFSDIAGITQIGGLKSLLAAGVVGAVAVVINFVVALELELRDRVLGKLVAAGTIFLAILIFLGFAAIIAVN